MIFNFTFTSRKLLLISNIQVYEKGTLKQNRVPSFLKLVGAGMASNPKTDVLNDSFWELNSSVLIEDMLFGLVTILSKVSRPKF